MHRSGEFALWAQSPRVDSRWGKAKDVKYLPGLALACLAAVLLSIGPPGSRSRGNVVSTTTANKAKPARAVTPVPAPPPAIDPLPLTADMARIVNAAVPFIPGPIAAARKFNYAGSAADRERALTCLASAAWYEAGDDKAGEQAVAQVVLNRLRHPAFPKTVCGVVFEGASRKTGCQFTFTCDGALRRTPSPEAWARARAIADHALSGFVFKKIGNATHYHADWVVPYWSDTLDKLAKVHDHLFYRWRGWWGTAAAFAGHVSGGTEQLDPRIAGLADADVAKIAASPSPDVVLSTAADGRQRLIATISPPRPPAPKMILPPSPATARHRPAAPKTILPLSPATARQVLPAVPGEALPVVDPATNRYWLPTRSPRVAMSFNQPGEAGGGPAQPEGASGKPHPPAK